MWATYPGAWKPASQRFSISEGQMMKWSALHPYSATRNWTHEQGGVSRVGVGKGDPTYKRFIISTCQQKKRAVRRKHGKIHQIWMCYTNPFHVRRNMSRFWSFPLISFWPNPAMSPLTNGLTPHEVQQQKRRGWNYLFITPVEPHLLTEFFHSPPRPGRGVQGQARGPLVRGVHAFHALYWRGPQSAQQQVLCSARLLSAAKRCLTHKFGCAGPIKRMGVGRRQSSPSFGGLSAPRNFAVHIASDICGKLPLRAHQMETKLAFCEYTMWKCSTSDKHCTFGPITKRETIVRLLFSNSLQNWPKFIFWFQSTVSSLR